MGSTFANLHVRSTPGALDAARAVLVDLLQNDGFVLTDGEPDREIALVDGDGWLSVYDPHAEDREDVLETATAALSARLGGPAVHVRVFDSDAVQLWGYEGGRASLKYSSDPEMLPGKRRTSAAAWSALLGVPESQIKPVFGGEALFAEAALEPLGAALGIGVRAGWGATDVPADAPRLRFRHAVRPAAEQRLRGAPALSVPGGTARTLEVAVGGELRLSLTAKSAGGPARGIRVRASAPPFVRLDSAQFVLGNPHDRNVRAVTLAPVDGGYAGEDPDAELPAGLGPIAPADLGKLGIHKAMALLHAANVHVNLVGRATSAGEGVVRLTLEPLGGPGGSVDLPVAARETGGIHPALLAPLVEEKVTTALILGDVSPARLAALAAVIAPFVADLPKVRTTVYPAGGGILGGKPKLTTGRSAGFFASDRWRALVAQVPAEANVVWAEWVRTPEDREPSRIELGRGLLPSPTAVNGLAIAVHGADCAAALTDAIDALAREGGVLQALVTRWGVGASLQGTPWELAHGVNGQCVSDRRWVERWARGIGRGAVWLGPALRAAAGEVAGTPVGETLRVDVADRASGEQVLRALIPNAQAWAQGVRMRYAP